MFVQFKLCDRQLQGEGFCLICSNLGDSLVESFAIAMANCKVFDLRDCGLWGNDCRGGLLKFKGVYLNNDHLSF